jgi:4'-phosphopantetheinyl transferase
MVVCAVAEKVDLGVDVEPLVRAEEILKVAPTVFAAEEQEALELLAEPDKRDRAVSLWTLKEAYIKARGMGLALPLKAFAFRFKADAPPEVSFVPPIVDRPERWSFRTFDVAGHRIALAVEGRDPITRLHATLPLRDDAKASYET